MFYLVRQTICLSMCSSLSFHQDSHDSQFPFSSLALLGVLVRAWCLERYKKTEAKRVFA